MSVTLPTSYAPRSSGRGFPARWRRQAGFCRLLQGRFLVTLLLLAALSGAACEEGGAQVGRVSRVLDGDSLVVTGPDGREIEVRVFGIDAPERRQPWSRRSREALRRLIEGGAVTLDVRDIDAYGRTVAVVRRQPDGLDAGSEMVRLGLAWVYRRYTDDARLISLEEEARAAGLGLWSEPASRRVPPWDWRRQNRRPAGDE